MRGVEQKGIFRVSLGQCFNATPILRMGICVFFEPDRDGGGAVLR